MKKHHNLLARNPIAVDVERPKQNLTPRVYRILVVEDNLDTVHTTCFLLRDMGYVCEYAINGYVALTEARRFKPDIVVCDIGLPGADGFEVCKQIRADPELSNVRMIALTAYGDPATRDRAKAAGFDDFQVKPLDPLTLLALIGNPKR